MALTLGKLFVLTNSRLNVNNAEYVQHREKRDRALNYWKNRVAQEFLPPIDGVKRSRGESLDKVSKLKEEHSPNRMI